MKNKLTIAIDFDETIVQMLREIAILKGEEWDYKDCINYTYPRKRWGKNVFYDYLLKAHQSLNLQEMPGAIKNIKILQDKYNIIILTCNQENHLPFIKSWLGNNELNIKVFRANDVEQKFTTFDWDILIDDHPEVNKLALKYKKIVIQYPQPYNNSIYIGFAWQHIPLIVNKLEQLMQSIRS